MKPEIHIVRARDINDDAFWRAIGQLRAAVWPPSEPMSPEEITKEVREYSQKNDAEIFTIWENERAVAHARLFAREIITPNGPLRVAALASVCTAPSHRGRNLGRLVVEAAFARVDNGRYPVSLFQTGVPQFYKKLGARKVFNRFFDGTSDSDATPWWNEPMIYPAAFAWPDGDIDLRGPAY